MRTTIRPDRDRPLGISPAGVSRPLHRHQTLPQTLYRLARAEGRAVSRFWFGSPCRYLRTLDIVCHIVVPELVEDRWPRLAAALRRTSPRWGRAWQVR